MRTTRRLLGALSVALVVSGLAAAPAVACGGLVAPNGTVRLLETATLAAYHQGIEHYITSFTFSGGGGEFGSIVPLPGIPSEVERGGDWMLQRLVRETNTARRSSAEGGALSAVSADSAQVLLEKRIDALDLTVLKGGAVAVGNWAREHGFNLSPDAPEVLEFYASRSPIFLAARFDANAAQALGQGLGDGTPIHVTIPTRTPWVPIRILSLGRGPDEPVEADVFLLTDEEPSLLGLRGMRTSRSSAAGQSLLDDLRSDKGMGWVPQKMWFTHLEVDAAAKELDHDLAISVDGRTPSRVDAGYDLAGATSIAVDGPLTQDDPPLWPFAVGTLALCTVAVLVLNRRFG
ncbi:MAG TPA: DUF2330 domain-containing protein [Acidimicrobiales bacterium]|nr:DUF2330 domain-containing protein [Acidimicrobiales bacterium]